MNEPQSSFSREPLYKERDTPQEGLNINNDSKIVKLTPGQYEQVISDLPELVQGVYRDTSHPFAIKFKDGHLLTLARERYYSPHSAEKEISVEEQDLKELLQWNAEAYEFAIQLFPDRMQDRLKDIYKIFRYSVARSSDSRLLSYDGGRFTFHLNFIDLWQKAKEKPDSNSFVYVKAGLAHEFTHVFLDGIPEQESYAYDEDITLLVEFLTPYIIGIPDNFQPRVDFSFYEKESSKTNHLSTYYEGWKKVTKLLEGSLGLSDGQSATTLHEHLKKMTGSEVREIAKQGIEKLMKRV